MTGPVPFDVIVVKVMLLMTRCRWRCHLLMSVEVRGDGGWSETYIIATNEHHNTQSCSICIKLSMIYLNVIV